MEPENTRNKQSNADYASMEYIFRANPNDVVRSVKGIAEQGNLTLIDTCVIPYMVKYISQCPAKEIDPHYLSKAVTFTNGLVAIVTANQNMCIARSQKTELADSLKLAEEAITSRLEKDQSMLSQQAINFMQSHQGALASLTELLTPRINNDMHNHPAYKSVFAVVKILDKYLHLKKPAPNRLSISEADEELATLMLFNCIINQKGSAVLSYDGDILKLARTAYLFLTSKDEFSNNTKLKQGLRENAYTVYGFDGSGSRVYIPFFSHERGREMDTFNLEKSGLTKPLREQLRNEARTALIEVMKHIEPERIKTITEQSSPKEPEKLDATSALMDIYSRTCRPVNEIITQEKLEEAVRTETEFLTIANQLGNQKMQREIKQKLETIKKYQSLAQENKGLADMLSQIYSMQNYHLNPDLVGKVTELAGKMQENLKQMGLVKEPVEIVPKEMVNSGIEGHSLLVNRLSEQGYNLGDIPVLVPISVIAKLTGQHPLSVRRHADDHGIDREKRGYLFLTKEKAEFLLPKKKKKVKD